MPIVGGQMYAELKPMIHNYTRLHILVIGDRASAAVQAIVRQVNVLDAYLGDIGKSRIKVTMSFVNTINDAELLERVGNDDIDVVFDQLKQFNEKFINKNFYTTEIVKSPEALSFSIESFLVGNGVAWRLLEPIWNMQLSLRYTEQAGLCRDFYTYMTQCQSTGRYTSDQIDRIRYIVNKIKQIDYARDLLHYYIKRLRKAERLGFADDDSYNLELNYHVSNYYFLLSGSLDSLARLLNDFYKLGLSRYSELALEKDIFIDKNISKHTGIGRLLKTRKFKNWMVFLKKRRNFIAHEGDMRQTPLVKEKSTLLTDKEINAIVDKQMDWKNFASLVPAVFSQEMYDAQRTMSFDMARIKNNYEVIARNVMHVPEKSGGSMWLPLMSVDFDYEHYAELMYKILVKLQSDI